MKDFDQRVLFCRVRIIFAGDDVTDEDAINAWVSLSIMCRLLVLSENVR